MSRPNWQDLRKRVNERIDVLQSIDEGRTNIENLETARLYMEPVLALLEMFCSSINLDKGGPDTCSCDRCAARRETAN